MSEIQYYVPIEEVEIERDSAGVNTYDAEGNPIHRFPADFTDEQVRHALGVINKFYCRGVSFGEWRKANEIKAALGVRDGEQ